MIAAQAHLDPRFKEFPNLPEERVRVDPRRADPRPREARGRAQRPHARAARVHARPRSSCSSRSPSQVAQSIEHAKLYAQAQRRVARAGGARADLRGRLGVALPRGVARGDRQDDDGRRRARPARRSCSRTARSPGPRVARASTRSGCRCAGSGRQIGELVVRPRHAVHGRGRGAARGDRPPRRRRARARARGDARRARPGDPPPGQEQPPDRRLAAAPAGARAEAVDPRKALDDSVNRILAIAAVHEVLTEHREDDVDLGELIDRLRAMLVQGLVAGKQVEADARAGLARRAHGDGARARLHASCSRTRSSTAASAVRIELAQRDGDVVLAIADDGDGHRRGERPGTGLSIVRALVRDELGGRARSAPACRRPGGLARRGPVSRHGTEVTRCGS